MSDLTYATQSGCLAGLVNLIRAGFPSPPAQDETDNPSQDLMVARAETESKKAGAAKRDQEKREKDYQALRAHGTRRDEVVLRMLDTLRLAVYAGKARFYQLWVGIDYGVSEHTGVTLIPDVRQMIERQPFAPAYYTWKISSYVADGHRKGWEDTLVIALLFSADRQPSGFLCVRRDEVHKVMRARPSVRGPAHHAEDSLFAAA
jgi:hypothetical protein